MFCNYDSGYGWLTNQKVVGLNLAIAGLLSTFLSLFLFQLNFTFTTSVLNQLSSLKEVFSKYDVKVEKCSEGSWLNKHQRGKKYSSEVLLKQLSVRVLCNLSLGF